MYLQLVRENFTDKSTEGKLFVNGLFECYTLEDKDRKLEDGNVKVYGESAIPRGKYNIRITHSNRFKKDLIKIDNVDGFSGVRIHSGNKPEDTEGCILVGLINQSNNDNFIGSSRPAYNALHNKVRKALDNGEEVTLEIV